MTYFAVTRARGEWWDKSISMRKQKRWNDHNLFMEQLADEGFVVLGGPLGHDEERFLLVVEAESEQAIRARFDKDPWSEMKLMRLAKIEPWEILLRKPEKSD